MARFASSSMPFKPQSRPFSWLEETPMPQFYYAQDTFLRENKMSSFPNSACDATGQEFWSTLNFCQAALPNRLFKFKIISNSTKLPDQTFDHQMTYDDS